MHKQRHIEAFAILVVALVVAGVGRQVALAQGRALGLSPATVGWLLALTGVLIAGQQLRIGRMCA